MTDVALIGGMLYVGIAIVVFVRMVAMGMGMIAGKSCMDGRRRSRSSEARFASP
jgi:hypothetical protein